MIGFGNATAVIASARRASAVHRYSSMNFNVELQPLAELASLTAEWRLLAACALEPNVFYEPSFALAAAPWLGRDVQVGLVWSRAPRRLVGLFPVRIERRRYGVPFAVTVGWTHPYAPLGTPLVDREMAEPVIATWLSYIADNAALPDLMLLPLIAQSGAFATTLADLLARGGCQATSFDRHQRALLLPGDSRADYFQRTMSGKRLRNMRRRQRRLQELGTVTLEPATGSDAFARGLDDFFALEATGWKGRGGTAASQNVNVRRFIERAVTALGGEDKVLIRRLCANGKAIAVTIALKSGDTAWGWKVAYDETYASYSPGVLAVAGLTETLLADPAITQADSCATATDTMASHLWNERLTLADWLFTAAADAEFSFALASRLEALRRAAITAAKSARDHLRRR
jgi:CelD/BcsL family acetyltransferase involved in cellulose biosynthesis